MEQVMDRMGYFLSNTAVVTQLFQPMSLNYIQLPSLSKHLTQTSEVSLSYLSSLL